MQLLLSTDWLAANLDRREFVIADVRWHTEGSAEARASFEKAHIPGAIYVDVDSVLSDSTDLTRGRHPLPDPYRFCRDLADLGIGEETKVIAYDDTGGSIAARLWWMLRWIGVNSCALLDGGLSKWQYEGRTIAVGAEVARAPASPFAPKPNSSLIITKHEIAPELERGLLLIDARAPERFRGEIEPIDALAGHIPGAVNAPWTDSLHDQPMPTFRPTLELRRRFTSLGVTRSRSVACCCGSGVTACLNILALELAGFPGARLYPGSWSEWIVDAAPTANARSL